MIETVRNAATALAFLSALLFCAQYQCRTKGHWRDTVHGVHLMTVSAAMTAYLLYVLLVYMGLIPDAWRPWFATAIFGSIAGLYVWRLVILRRGQRQRVETEK